MKWVRHRGHGYPQGYFLRDIFWKSSHPQGCLPHNMK
jgi:hypothetical protein